jgi:hypothetical protein
MEVQAQLITGILFAEIGVTTSHGQCKMKMIGDSSFVNLTQREMYGIAAIGLVDH